MSYRALGSLVLSIWLFSTVPNVPCNAKPVARAKAKSSVSFQWPSVSRVHDDPYDDPYAVGVIQQLLRYHSFFKSKPDSEFGLGTERAVKAFQKSRGLKADGVVGQQTWDKLVVRLKRSDRGEAVRAVRAVQGTFQYFFSEGGPEIYNVRYDGVYGFETEKAVRHFQAENKLPVDGVVGLQTWCVLVGGKVKKP